MSTLPSTHLLPHLGWSSYQSRPDAIGASRRLEFGDNDDGIFTIPSGFAFADFITDLYTGKSEYSSFFSQEEILGFIASKWHLFFIADTFRQSEDAFMKPDEFWSCQNGDEPKVILYQGETKAVGSIARLRPIDIISMWCDSPESLEALFPEKESHFSDRLETGERASGVYGTEATCVDCGETFSGAITYYQIVNRFQWDYSHTITPLALSMIMTSSGYLQSSKHLRDMSDSGVPLSVVQRYFENKTLDHNSLKAWTPDYAASYPVFSEMGMNDSLSARGSVLVAHFDEDERDIVIDMLKSQNAEGDLDMDYYEKLLAVFIESENKDAALYVKLISLSVDAELAESFLR
jgi:hypothetical protein